MFWTALGLIYLAVGTLVALAFWPWERRATGRSPKAGYILQTIIIWPFLVVSDVERLFKARNATYIPPLTKRSIGPYLAELAQHRRFDPHQVERIEHAYRQLFEHLKPSEHHRPDPAGYIRLLENEHLAFLLDGSPSRIVRETQAAWKARREHIASVHAKGHHVNFGLPRHVVVHEDVHATLYEMPEMARRNTISALLELGKAVDRSRSTDHANVRSTLVMNGPLPCLLVGGATAVVVEPTWGDLYILGVLSNRGA